jgi:serine/threonine protein kinase
MVQAQSMNPEDVDPRVKSAENLISDGFVSDALELLEAFVRDADGGVDSEDGTVTDKNSVHRAAQILEWGGRLEAAEEGFDLVTREGDGFRDAAARLAVLRGRVSNDEFKSEDTLQGQVLAERYVVERAIGRGSQACVYQGYDEVLSRPVALKVLNASSQTDPATKERFQNEARMAARVTHRACVAIHDYGIDGDWSFMALEYFPGLTLRQVLKDGPLLPITAVGVACEVAYGLGGVHKAGLVHRDVKPSNILLNRDGQVRLTDFGVAAEESDVRSKGLMVGTIKYMAPEQAQGKLPDRRADIFSLGVVLYEMLTGQPPFSATLQSLVERVRKPSPVLPDAVDVPAIVRDIVACCISRHPDQRYGDVGPLIRDLKYVQRCIQPDPGGPLAKHYVKSSCVDPLATRDEGIDPE